MVQLNDQVKSPPTIANCGHLLIWRCTTFLAIFKLNIQKCLVHKKQQLRAGDSYESNEHLNH